MTQLLITQLFSIINLISISTLVLIRNFYKTNFFVKINTVYSNLDKKYYSNKSNKWLLILFKILYLVPFPLVKILFYILNYINSP